MRVVCGARLITSVGTFVCCRKDGHAGQHRSSRSGRAMSGTEGMWTEWTGPKLLEAIPEAVLSGIELHGKWA
jgi:hypothetical protein